MEYVSSIRGIDTHRIRANEPDAAILKKIVKFDNEKHKEFYQNIKDQLDTLFAYMNQLGALHLESDDRQKLIALQNQCISLSNACKSTENVRENIETVKNSLHDKLSIIYYEILDHIIALNKAVYNIIDGTVYEDADNLAEVIAEVSEYRNNILSHIAPYVVKGNVGDMDISSLVNMLRELTDGYKDIAYSLE